MADMMSMPINIRATGATHESYRSPGPVAIGQTGKMVTQTTIGIHLNP
jgi:hypothetical protein